MYFYAITNFDIPTFLVVLPHSNTALFSYTWCWLLSLQLPTGWLCMRSTRGHIDTLMQNPFLGTTPYTLWNSLPFDWFDLSVRLWMKLTTKYISNCYITFTYICSWIIHEGNIWTLWPSTNHTPSRITLYSKIQDIRVYSLQSHSNLWDCKVTHTHHLKFCEYFPLRQTSTHLKWITSIDGLHWANWWYISLSILTGVVLQSS